MTEEYIEYEVECYALATVHAQSETEAKRKAKRGQYEHVELFEAEYVEKSDAQLLHEQQDEEEEENE